MVSVFFFFQAEDGIRDLVRSRGLGDVYKRQGNPEGWCAPVKPGMLLFECDGVSREVAEEAMRLACLLYTSDAADERSSVDLGGRRIIKKKNSCDPEWVRVIHKYS